MGKPPKDDGPSQTTYVQVSQMGRRIRVELTLETEIEAREYIGELYMLLEEGDVDIRITVQSDKKPVLTFSKSGK